MNFFYQNISSLILNRSQNFVAATSKLLFLYYKQKLEKITSNILYQRKLKLYEIV